MSANWIAARLSSSFYSLAFAICISFSLAAATNIDFHRNFIDIDFFPSIRRCQLIASFITIYSSLLSMTPQISCSGEFILSVRFPNILFSFFLWLRQTRSISVDTSSSIHGYDFASINSFLLNSSIWIGRNWSSPIIRLWFRETIASVSEFYPLVSVISFIRSPFDWNNLIDVRRSRFGKSALLFRLDQFSLVNSSIAIVHHHLYIDMVPLVYRSGEFALSVGFRNFFSPVLFRMGQTRSMSVDLTRRQFCAVT